MKEIISTENICVHIKDKQIIRDITMGIEKGKIYSIIGPNGSGKTTLLRALSRNIKPASGAVRLDGENIYHMSTRQMARKMAVLTQVHAGMNDITVRQLISYGRFAHRDWWKGRQKEDSEIIDACIHKTGLGPFAERRISALSGGESQRAWIAMALAQKPQLLLLDEPTTFLDIAHQIEILELVSRLNQEEGITILMVLHDINYAARYSDELIVIRDGSLYASGQPWDILTPEILRDVFHVEAIITKDIQMGKPIFYAKSVVRQEEIG